MNKRQRMKGWILVALAIAWGMNPIKAQVADTLNLTIEKALNIALAENPVIKVSNAELTLKKVADREAWQKLLPEASINGSLDHTIQAAEMKLNDLSFKMGKDGTNTANVGLVINLPLFVPAVYKAMSISKTDIELALEKSRSSKQDLINQLTKAYYQLMLSQDSYIVLLKSYQLAEEKFNIINAKFQQGKVSEFDKISAEVQMRSVKPNVISAANAVTLAKLQLKVLMGISDSIEIKIMDSLNNYEVAVSNNQMDDMAASLESNSSLRQMELSRTLLRKNLRLLETNFMPTLSLAFSYKSQSLYNNHVNLFNYSWSNSSSLMLNVSIPLYRASNFTKLKSARIQMEQLEWNRLDLERKLKMQIISSQNNMLASSEQTASNKVNVMQAKKAVEIATKRYEVGKGTVLELNSSQVSLTQAELSYNQSIYNYLISKADFEYVLGKNKWLSE